MPFRFEGTEGAFRVEEKDLEVSSGGRSEKNGGKPTQEGRSGGHGLEKRGSNGESKGKPGQGGRGGRKFPSAKFGGNQKTGSKGVFAAMRNKEGKERGKKGRL